MIIIKDKQAYYGSMAQIEGYLKKGFDHLTEDEDRHLDELSKAVEAWEIKAYPMPHKPGIKDVLLYIMRQSNLTQNDLSEKLDVSKSLVSEILSDKKKPNLSLLKSLHDVYQIDGNLLLELV